MPTFPVSETITTDQKERLHSIQQASTKLNIPKPTLRFWEKEFESLLSPLRTEGGQRSYNYEHIAIVEKINALKKWGLSLRKLNGNWEGEWRQKVELSGQKRGRQL